MLKTNLCFQDIFESNATKYPEAVSVVCGNEQITYRELSLKSDQLALQLQTLGVKPNALVGICVERSIDMIIGILGILKSGGAYVPLDPTYPHERLSFILEDANIQVVVTQPKLFDALSGEIPHIVYVSDILSASIRQPNADLRRNVSPMDLAYVIYTSGSTGKPKGVMITHENLYNFIGIACQALDVTSDDVYLQTASISYALSVRQIMIPLSYGATLVIADAEEMRDPLLLFKLIKEKQISLMDLVPSFWRTCLQRLLSLSPEEQRMLMDNCLRRIVSIGEMLLSDIPRDWRFSLGHHAKLVNIFGQTETTGVVATYPIPAENKNEIEAVPIGWNVPDTKIYILDSDLQPVPTGETGELCVSSPCIALGYLNRPELTRQKFITNPFGDTGSDRLYRSGDIARCRADGAIEFLGRSDFQVKIRGQRLELGEVESVLLECPFVQACAVVAQGENSDNKHLTAFIVPLNGQTPTTVQVRQYMKKRVPEYMVPSIILFLDALPLMPNGKLDRLSLSDPAFINNISFMETKSAKQLKQKDEPAETRNYVDRKLVDIWQSLLKVDKVGYQDNFFDLGGDSLAAASLLISIETTFGKRISVATFFKSPTIEQLVEAICETDKSETIPKGNQSLIPIHIGDSSKSPFFWLHGSDFAYMKPYLDPSQPFYCIMPSGLIDGEPILEDRDEIVEHHLRAIQSQNPTGPYLLGGYCNGGKNAIAVALRLIEYGHEVRLLALVDVPIPDQKRKDSETQSIYKRVIDHVKRGRFWDVAQEKLRDKFGLLINLLTKNTHMLQFKRITQAHDRVFKYYVMPRPFSGKISLFTCQDQYEIAKDDLDQRWSKLTTKSIKQYIIPGNHTTMIRKPNIKILGERLKEAIADAQIIKRN